MFFEKERINRVLKDLKDYIYPKKEQIEYFLMKKGDFSNPKEADENEEQWTTFPCNERWGGKDQRYWFKTEVTIPVDFEGKTVVFELTTGREGEWDAINPQFLIYLNGKVVQGLDTNHREIIVCEKAIANEKHIIDLHAYAGMKEGEVELKGKIAVLDRVTERLYYDIKVPLEVADLLEKEDKRRIDILNFLTESINILDLRKPHSRDYYLSIEDADKYLREKFYEEYCGEEDVIAACVGHTHIDVAWLWTLRQTREKVARSFSTVLNLMKQYPEYLFMSSQPQLYKYLKQNNPEIYDQVKEKIKEGKWEAEGGMWLEADCNLASGESLIRQILFGTRFFKEEFGIDNKILWLPDVFGYSAALPQILKKFHIDYFMTTKISWNEYNKVPYDTFMWEGIDGSSILSYFITTIDYKTAKSGDHRTRYEGFLGASEVKGAWHRYQQKKINNEVLISYGYGDGGGGPTKEMLENARRLEKGIPGCPKVKMEKTRDFFEKLEDRVGNNKRLPKWVGELYLEYHRGTYTSMGRNKRYNRKSEFLFQDAEFFNLMNTCIDKTIQYPQKRINEGWETILLNQFHDIIPGSSIKEVYDESKEQYEKVLNDGNALLKSAVNEIAGKINLNERSLIVFNQLSFIRSDIVIFDIPEGMDNLKVKDEQGNVYPVQPIENNKGLFYAENVPSKGYKSFSIFEGEEETVENLTVSTYKISNKFFDITLDENYNIFSIYDKINNRKVLKAFEKGNVLQAFEDKPHLWDAWDINIYYQEKMWEINHVEEVKVISDGPVRATIRIKRKFLDSTITQYMHVYNHIPRIDFENEIDWKEKQILLKVAFPVDVHTNKATYEIQYGNVERPTHWNTSWDMAKFEVCAHKWADLSEDNYGVSLLNDCKYGHDIKDGTLRLSLIKSPIWPNPDADRELHKFTYSLYPHKGDWKLAQTTQMAYNLNCPMYAKIEEAHSGALPKELSFISLDSENVIIEAVKKAEDSNEVIVRLYEYYNRRTTVTVNFYKELESVHECDLMEQELEKIKVCGNSFEFEIKPYEIKTFKLNL
ncbi:alpha-mannosidase [Oceanirhabdus sp. W0125-5]|uniref:alpha-mannosidase n=1 Tax=Oceanirhabdus sp. W0125-5 TaxID=2999116 RepID=UPI0022F2D400|nr:alpha-mannosidase [Oceanirhabdus sp. W0125-5]WBW97283.1 alpha-mannosidase [Oceanirhabdus sp. W0125-5]